VPSVDSAQDLLRTFETESKIASKRFLLISHLSCIVNSLSSKLQGCYLSAKNGLCFQVSQQVEIHRIAVHFSFTEAVGLSKRVQLTAFDKSGGVLLNVV